MIALAERLNITTVVTLDRRDFGIVRPAHVPALTLLSCWRCAAGLESRTPDRLQPVPERRGKDAPSSMAAETGNWHDVEGRPAEHVRRARAARG